MRKMKLVALFTAALVAVSSLPVYAANFADINNVPWEGAKTYINSVADKGIMVGDYNASGQKVFRPRDGVTYCETMQLAYSLMKNDTGKAVDSSIVSKYATVMNGYKIPTWAQEAVAYGLENKIVTISEIPAFVNSKGVSVNATRQDVAIIFGRTLDLIEELPKNATLTYGDKASVTSVAVPYVALLKQLNIMTGDTDNNFTPKASINRAEMAVVVSKTYDHLAGKDTPATAPSTTVTTGSVSGKITNVVTVGNNTTIVVNGKQYLGNVSTGVLDTNSVRIPIAQLEIGDEVVVSYSGSSIKSVMVTKSAPVAQQSTKVNGDFVSITSKAITLKVGSKTNSYTFSTDDVYYRYEGATKTYGKFEDLVEKDDEVYLELDSKGHVVYVEVEKAESEYDVEDTFYSLTEEYIRLEDSDGDKEYYYFKGYEDDEDDIYENVDFYNKNEKSVDFDDFEELVEDYDGRIGLMLNSDDEVTDVYIIEGDDEIEDTFYSVDENRIRLEDSKGSKKYYYFKGYADKEKDIYKNVEFYDEYEDEVDFDDFEDLVKDYEGEIRLVLNDDEEVVEVYILDDTSSGNYDETGYYYSMSDERIRLVETDKSNDDDYTSYYYKGYEDKESNIYKNVKFYDSDEEEIDYDDFKDLVEDGDKVGLVFNSDKEVTKVYLLEGNASASTNEVTGQLEYVGTSVFRLKSGSRSYHIKNASSVEVAVKDGDHKLDEYNELVNGYSEESKDFKVTIVYDDDYYVKEIEGYITALYAGNLTYVSTSGNGKIKVKCDGTEYTYQLAKACTFDNGNPKSYDNNLKGLYEVFDDESDVTVDLEFNSSGSVTKVVADY